MKAWLSHHAQAFKGALRKLAGQPVSSLLNVLVMGIALALPAGGHVLLANLQGIALRFSLEPQISVFLAATAETSTRDALDKSLRADARVSSVRFIPKSEALAELRKTPGIAEVVAALNQNPLPDTFVLKLRPSRPGEMDGLASELRKRPGVAAVQADTGWARRLAALIDIGQLTTAMVGALLSAGLIAVTFNTIRLQVLTQREEIEVARLLGATDSFIRRPFYYVGALQGVAGGGVALAILAGSLHLLNQGVRPLSETYGAHFELGFLAPGDAAAVAVLAGLLGWLGAYLSVSIYLRGIEPK
ncbi:MAG: permease-like cell division protein FtsX [Betaproteobacteria bacterium]